MSSELIAYSTGTTVTSAWLNSAQLREERTPAYIVYKAGSTYFAKAMLPAGTDYTSTTDAAIIIRNALNAISSTGGLIYVKGPATFPLNTTAVFGSNNACIGLPDNTSLVGSGFDAVLQATASVVLGDNDALISNLNADVTGGKNLLVSNLTVDGNKANRSASKTGLLSFNGAGGAKGQNNRVANLYMKNANGNAIAYRNNNYGFISNCWCDSNGSVGIGTPSGLYLISNTNMVIQNVIVSNGAWRGVKIDSCNNLQFNNCAVYNGADNGFGVSLSSDIDFVDCIAEGNTAGGGLSFDGASIADIRIIGGSYSGNNFGLNLANTPTRVTIQGVRVSNQAGSNAFGIWLSNTMTNCVISGCIIQNNASDGIRIDSPGTANILISGNRCLANGGNGINITATPTGAINILGNDLTGQTGIAYSGSATTLITTRSNQNWNPQAASNVTAGASIWTYTNNDNYDETMVLNNLNGGTVSAISYKGDAGYPTTVNGFPFFLQPGQTITVTWATTAPTFRKYPQ